MRPIVATLTAALVTVAGPSWAQTTMDTDGDGNVSLAELQVAYPEATEETFTAMDLDGDGVLNASEVTAAQDAGTLPAS